MSRVTTTRSKDSATLVTPRSPALRIAAGSAPAVALAFFLALAIRAGLPISQALWGLAIVATTQLIPGALVWRAVRPIDGWWIEDAVMGLAIGASIAVAAQAVAGVTSTPWIALAVGPAVGVVLAALPPTRQQIRGATTQPLPLWWGPLTAGLSLTLAGTTESFFRIVPYGWAEGFRATYVDMPFHLALVGQLAHRGPLASPQVASEPLMYHWFSHAWMAQVATAGIDTDAMTLRFAPALLAVAVITAIAIAAVRLSGRPWAGPMAVFLAVAAGYVDVVGGVLPVALVHHLSPSLQFSAVVLVALVVVLGVRWQASPRRGTILLVPLLAFTAVGSKASSLSVALAGAGLAAVVAVATRHEHRRRVVADLALMLASFVGAYVTLFASSTRALAFDPAAALAVAAPVRDVVAAVDVSRPATWTVVAVLLVGSVTVRGVGLLAAWAVPRLRRDPVVYLLLGIGLAGAGAVLLFSHPGRSQYYFLRNAGPMMAIGSAIGVTALAEGLGRRRLSAFVGGGLLGLGILFALGGLRTLAVRETHTLLFAYATWAFVVVVALAGGAVVARFVNRRGVLLATALVALLTMATAPGVIDLASHELPSPRVPLPPDAPRAFSADQIDAARWLRDHSGPRDLVMTNRHCGVAGSGATCDARRFFVTAYTERLVLVEGWAYTPTWSGSELPAAERTFWEPDLLALNDAFLEAPTAGRAARLRDLGVRWIYVDKTAPYSDALSEFAEPRHETAWAWVLELER